jgi:phage terminase large subunit-like protein
MEALCNEIQTVDERVFKRLPKDKDVVINVPPGTSKTKIISILSTAWEFARMPSIKVFVGSYSDSAISGIADEIRLVMKSDKYRRWFPETVIRRDRDSLHNFKTTKNGEFYAFTVGGTLTSKHADILKVDDPLNPKQATSEADLLSANTFFDQTLPSRKVDKLVTPTYLVMQRLASNDPTGYLLEKKKDEIHHICFPAELSPLVKPWHYKLKYTNGLLDEHRLSRKALKDAKTDLGSYAYAGQYDQSPTPAGGLIWQEWFVVHEDYDFPNPDFGSALGSDWDLAYTSKEENAASAYVTSFKYKNHIWITDVGWDWLEFPQLIHWMKTKTFPHYIEGKASGKSAKQVLSKAGIPAIEVPVKGGEDKVARARNATPTAESGIVHIKKSLVDKVYRDPKQGILAFPKGTFKDLADALAQCIQRHMTSSVHVMDDSSDFDVLGELDWDE